MTDDNALPELLRDIAAAADESAALAVARAFGGRRAYLRVQSLAPIVGEDAARKIVGAVGTGMVEIPQWRAHQIAARNVEMVARYLGGESQRELAARFNVTERTVRHVVAAAKREHETRHGAAPSPAGSRFQESKKMSKYIGPNHGKERRFMAEPQLGDWLELRNDISLARGSGGISDQSAGFLSEEWEEMTLDQRLAAWHSAQINLLDIERMHKQFPTTR